MKSVRRLLLLLLIISLLSGCSGKEDDVAAETVENMIENTV